MPRDPRLLEECRAFVAAVTPHPTLRSLRRAAEWPSLTRRLATVLGEVRRTVPASPPAPPRDPARVSLVQWNIEHGNAYDAIARALTTHPDLVAADVVTLDEVDLGCARSGNRDVAGELAGALGLHGAWAPLFLETTAGRDDDVVRAAGRANEEGLFGIAVLSRWPIGTTRIVELPGKNPIKFDVERMVGRHVALIAEILRPGAPFLAVATHLEVHRTRKHRAVQARAIVYALDGETRPIVIAGDFNTHTFDRGLRPSALAGAVALLFTPSPWLQGRFLHPDRGRFHERVFDVLRDGGFPWEHVSDFSPTLRLRHDRLREMRALPPLVRGIAQNLLEWAVSRAELRLDWIATRGWQGGSGRTVHGLDGPGRASDHAPVVALLG